MYYIPREIILSCLEYYEKNDLYLKINNLYFQKKEDLLLKKFIHHEDFTKFIKDTRGIEFTKFFKIKSIPHYFFKKSIFIDIEHDLITNKFIYLKPNMNVAISKNRIDTLFEVYNNQSFLILDLRNSFGGYLNNCLNFCRALMPESEIFTAEYKDKTITYFSDKLHHIFSKIFILINQQTASSSEILAYSLNSLLPNVELIGSKTYGKLYGQHLFTSKKYKYNFYVTTFKWSINNFVFNDVKIYPEQRLRNIMNNNI